MTTKGRQASDRLTIALLTAASQGLRAHCSDVATHHYWLSEYPEERALAVRTCVGCPVFVDAVTLPGPIANSGASGLRGITPD
jgi:hypothetical protein